MMSCDPGADEPRLDRPEACRPHRVALEHGLVHFLAPLALTTRPIRRSAAMTTVRGLCVGWALALAAWTPAALAHWPGQPTHEMAQLGLGARKLAALP
jgi:hypothetical protein